MTSNGNSFDGATALVTGAAGGLGSAIGAALQARGARVVSLDLAPAAGADLHIDCDVTDASAVVPAATA